MSLLDPPKRKGFRLEVGVARFAGLWSLVLTLLCVGSVLAQAPGLRLDLFTPAVVFVALELELLAGLLAASGIGLMADVFAGDSPGLFWSSAVVSFLVLRLFVFRVVGSRPLVVTALVLLTMVCGWLVRTAVAALVGLDLGAGAGFGAQLLAGALLGYPLYRLLATVDRRLRPSAEQFFRTG